MVGAASAITEDLGLRLTWSREWSPQQISRRLVLDFPDDPGMRVSHETIYLSILQAEARALTPPLHRRLRTGRPMRLPLVARQHSGRGQIRNMTSIHDRAPHIENHADGGHWEGDLLMGRVMGRRPSAVATLVERHSRYLRLVALAGEIKAPGSACGAGPGSRPGAVLAAPQPDLGRGGMADHQTFAKLTGCRVYFCDPTQPVAARHE